MREKTTYTGCDFCTEIYDLRRSLFYKIYKNTDISSRVIGETRSFIVFPTIGHFIKYYLIIIPKRHIESMSKLEIDELIELQQFIEKIKTALSQYGYVVCFEHGGGLKVGGSCSVYHAHMHIMPLPSKLRLSSFFHDNCSIEQSNNFTECYISLKNTSQYLFTMETDGNISFIDTSNTSHLYSSQYFRKKISDYYKINASWNWREYNSIEENLMDTIRKLKISNI